MSSVASSDPFVGVPPPHTSYEVDVHLPVSGDGEMIMQVREPNATRKFTVKRYCGQKGPRGKLNERRMQNEQRMLAAVKAGVSDLRERQSTSVSHGRP